MSNFCASQSSADTFSKGGPWLSLLPCTEKKLAGTFTPGGGGGVFVGRRPPPPAPAPCLKSSMCEFGRVDTVLLGVFTHRHAPEGGDTDRSKPHQPTRSQQLSNQNLRKQTPSTDQKATVKPYKRVLGLAPAKTKWVLGLALAPTEMP